MSKSNPGLDMKHGFLHHIRRNQIKRNEYDQEQRVSKDTRKNFSTHNREKYPDREIYRPQQESNSPVHQKKKRDPIYVLEYRDKNKIVHKIIVHEGDDPLIIAKQLMKRGNIPSELLETLQWKIEQDIIKFSNAVD